MILYRTFVLFHHLPSTNLSMGKYRLKLDPTHRRIGNIRFTRLPRT
ncbi:hypothetical protein LEP1GSC050_2415 [Leptospira broomii serovar Hurstbridge str. 5399]|uniref:Uncharacterized protein n=1 Tax=Leptospira broomii serovar Hurstbridge str. 5399 TaxID=1049789 RepID=T0EYY5_9LEPT|nr:hypothetical protein LEP1GSC050_2415 [Leptospira broomii serovar Hurstbridge str. 5399]